MKIPIDNLPYNFMIIDDCGFVFYINDTLTQNLKKNDIKIETLNQIVRYGTTEWNTKSINLNMKIKYKIIPLDKKKSLVCVDFQNETKLIDSINHQMRTPLNGIVNILSLLSDTPLTEDQIEYIGLIKESSNNLMNIVNEISDISKLEEGHIILNMKPINLQKSIETAQDVVLMKAREKNVTLSNMFDDKVPKYVLFDLERLMQIIINLLSNAIKNTRRDKILTRIHLIKKMDSEVLLEFVISDDLVVPENAIDHQVDSSEGLSLIICKKLCELTGGTFSLKKYDRTNFYIFTIKTSVAKEILDVDSLNLEDSRIMIIDPDELHRAYLVKIMVKFKILHKACLSLEDIKSYLSVNEFDAIIIDGSLEELAVKIKAMKQGVQLVEIRTIGEKKHDIFDRHLIKPVKEKKLLEVLHELSIQVNMSILVVDDVYINQRVVINTLINKGFKEIRSADNGENALEIMKNEIIDIVFMDIVMPGGMDGLETLKIIRKNVYLKNPYVIAMTGHLKNRDLYLEQGFDDFLGKPVGLEEINGCLNKYMAKNKILLRS